jgi:hypothetical protein
MARESFYIFLQNRYNLTPVEFYKKLSWTRQQWHLNNKKNSIPRQDMLKRLARKLHLKLSDLEGLVIVWLKK